MTETSYGRAFPPKHNANNPRRDRELVPQASTMPATRGRHQVLPGLAAHNPIPHQAWLTIHDRHPFEKPYLFLGLPKTINDFLVP